MRARCAIAASVAVVWGLGCAPVEAPEPAAADASDSAEILDPFDPVPPVWVGDGLAGIENVFLVDPGVYSGSGPMSEEAFDSLAELGVRTVISVDGARPALEMAGAHGMRYVHLPIGYDGIEPGRALELAKAVRDMPGPVYVHCHHGKHRGPAAAAAALIQLGRMTNREGGVFLEAAGTSLSYPGLWVCVDSVRPAMEAELDAMTAALPEHEAVSGLAEGMVAVNAAWENLGLIREAGWVTPDGHPDLVPAAEAGALADHLRVLAMGSETAAEGAEFVRLMEESAAMAGMLEAGLEGGEGSATGAGGFESLYLAVSGTCSGCHGAYRN